MEIYSYLQVIYIFVYKYAGFKLERNERLLKMDFAQHVKCYTKLLDHGIIRKFLRTDPCAVLADKYHLVIIFQYFMRADYSEADYTPRNFFLALSLSHDIFDELSPKKRIMKYCLAKENNFSMEAKKTYHWDKIRLYKRMNYKGFMEKKVCHNLFGLIPHKSIMRGRKEIHVGSFSLNNPKTICQKCNMPRNRTLSIPEEITPDNDINSMKNEDRTPFDAISHTKSISESFNAEWDEINEQSCSPKSSSRLSARSCSRFSGSSSMDLDPYECIL